MVQSWGNIAMMPNRLELWTRAADGPPDDVVARLDRLVAIGRIDDYELHSWDRRATLTDPVDGPDTHIAGRVLAFALWAAQHGVTLPTMGPLHRVGCADAGPATLAVDLPSMVLVDYAADEVAFVAPCVDDDTVHTVRGYLDRLELPGPDRGETGQTAPV